MSDARARGPIGSPAHTLTQTDGHQDALQPPAGRRVLLLKRQPLGPYSDHMAETRWLSDEEQRAWRKLVAVLMRLPGALEAQLQRDAGVTHFEYWVIALLSEAPERALRLSTLAAQANASLSRLSHVVTRLEKRGWVVRRPAADGSRAMLAVLTDDGYDKVVASAPGHVQAVQSLVFAGLSADQLGELDRTCSTLLARLGEPRPAPPA
jgi:DNA-binding MarR family transcriptional regulator